MEAAKSFSEKNNLLSTERNVLEEIRFVTAGNEEPLNQRHFGN